jgi:signal transduction histidine kinase
MEQAGFRQQSLASMPATVVQKRVARIFSGTVACIVLLALPFAHKAWEPTPQFNSLYASLACFADLITAYLLFGQFLRTRQLFIALLSATYLFSSSILVFYVFTLPNLISAHDWPHVGRQTIPWLAVFWHTGFPLGIFSAMLIEIYSKRQLLSKRQIAIVSALFPIIVLLFVVLLSFIAIYFSSSLPVLNMNGNYRLTNTLGIRLTLLVLDLAAAAICLIQARRGTVLHLWLSVAMTAALFDMCLSLWAGSLYSIGWYLSRINGLIASTVVLAILLYEVNRLYETVTQQNDLLEKHREDLEKKNQMLEHQNQMQKDFVSIVGHEFRTALTTIQGFGEVIAEEMLAPEEIREYVSDMCSEAHRLSRLITEQLDLDRMKSGQMQLRSEVVDLNDLIKELAHRTNTQSLEHKIRLDLERSLPSLWADRDRLTQVLLNLLSNAVKYSPEGGEVVISSTREGAWIHLTVQDQGIGIPPEKLEQVFEQYTRVDSESSRFIGGTGLGLSVVKQIVQMHGGSVFVESVVNKGSTFHVKLPLVRVPLIAEPVGVR